MRRSRDGQWEKIHGGRIRKWNPDGFWEIKPEDLEDTAPFTCPVCHSLMIGAEDISAWKSYRCCGSCQTFWAEPNRDRWRQGWRPTPEQVESKKAVR